MTTLSIGMIVKNEEAKLRQTLEALQPLREAIHCQLIIADTGSEDDTIAIAKEFTEEVFSISWENDFAKARNETLRRARGQWFFFLDADEVLSDSEELIAFLQDNKKNRQYQTARIMIRNITSYKNLNYQDFWSARIFRRRADAQFAGAIHEGYPIMEPTYILRKTKLMHSGYNNDDSDFMERKSQRNIAILEKQLEKEQDNYKRSKLLLEYADSLAIAKGRGDEVFQAAEEASILLQQLPEKDERRLYLIARAYSLQIRACYNQRQMEKCLEVGAKYFEVQTQRSVGDTDIYFVMGDAYWNLGREEESIDSFQKYLTCREQDQIVSSKYLIIASMNMADKAHFALSQCYRKLKEYDRAWECALAIEKDSWYGVNMLQHKWCIAVESRADERLPELWAIFDENARVSMIAGMAGAIAKVDNEQRQSIAAGLRQLADDERIWPILALCTDNKTELLLLLEKMGDKLFDAAQGEILYQCLQLDAPMAALLPHLDIEFLESYINTCAVYHPDMAQDTLRYYQNVSPETLPLAEHYLAQYMLCHNLFCTDVAPELIGPMWDLTLAHAYGYIQRIYSAEMIDEGNRWLLSPLEQFILKAHQAEDKRHEQDYKESIIILREGLTIYPKANDTVKHLLAEIEDLADPIGAEMKRLAANVKTQIRQLIDNDEMDEAESLLDELLAIVPDDPDLPQLIEDTRSGQIIWN